MRFIAWLITLAENSDRIAEAAADWLRAKLGGHTDMVVRIINFLLITAGISSPLLMYFAGLFLSTNLIAEGSLNLALPLFMPAAMSVEPTPVENAPSAP